MSRTTVEQLEIDFNEGLCYVCGCPEEDHEVKDASPGNGVAGCWCPTCHEMCFVP